MGSISVGSSESLTALIDLVERRADNPLCRSVLVAPHRRAQRGEGHTVLRDWLMSLAAFARRAADRPVGVVFVIS
jgi:hypothetical protein